MTQLKLSIYVDPYVADILYLLKFSCKDLWINPPHFVSVFIIQTKSFGEGRSTGLYFFVCFALINICIYILSSIVHFLYRYLWNPLHNFPCLGDKCGPSSKDRCMRTEGLKSEEKEVSRRCRKTTDTRKLISISRQIGS